MRVEAHNVCREVENLTGAPIMIPHATPEEWSVGTSAFLQNPYQNVNVSPCPSGPGAGLWYWELLDVFVRRCQLSLGSGTCTDYPDSGGMPITTRFPQYDNPIVYGPPDTMPDCGPERAGERVRSNEVIGNTSQTLFSRQFVCNRAAEIAPISLPNITLRVGQAGTVGQITVSGLPHTGTEALISGSEGVARLIRNGVAGSPYHRAIPMGHITPSSPYLALFGSTYGGPGPGSGFRSGTGTWSGLT